jgi:hypothetical protein
MLTGIYDKNAQIDKPLCLYYIFSKIDLLE